MDAALHFCTHLQYLQLTSIDCELSQRTRDPLWDSAKRFITITLVLTVIRNFVVHQFTITFRDRQCHSWVMTQYKMPLVCTDTFVRSLVSVYLIIILIHIIFYCSFSAEFQQKFSSRTYLLLQYLDIHSTCIGCSFAICLLS